MAKLSKPVRLGRRQVLTGTTALVALAAVPVAVKADDGDVDIIQLYRAWRAKDRALSPTIARLAAVFWRALGEHHAMLSSPDHTDADADRTGNLSGDAYCDLLEVPAITLADLGEKARVIWADGPGVDPRCPQLIYDDFTLLMLFRDIERVTGCEPMTCEYDSARGYVPPGSRLAEPFIVEVAGKEIGWRDAWGVS